MSNLIFNVASRAGNGNCLLDRPDNIMLRDDPSRLPGEDYTVNKQCELVFGNGSRICSHMVGDGKSHIFVCYFCILLIVLLLHVVLYVI